MIVSDTSSVGKVAVRLTIAAACNVMSACSKRSASLVQGLGLQTINCEANLEVQV